MFGELVYRLGKRYSQIRRENPEIEYPYFSGAIADLVDQDTLKQLPDLQGEYVVAYNADGASHMIHVYFEQGMFEAEGGPTKADVFGLTTDSDVGQLKDD